LTSRLSGAHSHPPPLKKVRPGAFRTLSGWRRRSSPLNSIRSKAHMNTSASWWRYRMRPKAGKAIRRIESAEERYLGRAVPFGGAMRKKVGRSASVQAAALLSCRVQRKIFRRLRPARAAAGLPAEYKTRLECDARISRRFARGSPDCSGVAKRAVRATSPSVALSLSWLPDRRRGPLLRYKTRAKSSRPCRHRSAASRPS
jgi:hypothetical protein